MTVQSFSGCRRCDRRYTRAVRGTGAKILGVAAGVAVAGILIGFYISGYLVGNTTPFRPAVPDVERFDHRLT